MLATMIHRLFINLSQIPHILHLDERYLIAALDIHPTQVRPSHGFFRAPALHPNLQFNMGGDTLTLSYANSNSQTPDEEKMKQLYKIGLELAGELV